MCATDSDVWIREVLSIYYWDVLLTGQIRSLLICKENDRSALSSPPSRKRSRYRTCLGRNLVYSPCPCSECRWQFVTSTTVSCSALCTLAHICKPNLRQDRIRAAVVRLLLSIKNTPSIKYYHHVVPVDHLTPRLEEEGRINPYNAVASGLMALMLNAIALSPFGRMINPCNAVTSKRRRATISNRRRATRANRNTATTRRGSHPRRARRTTRSRARRARSTRRQAGRERNLSR
jgi:hypothetical protein